MPAWELRVLSGIHQHAHAPIADGALIGADPECDIVLADAGIASHMARVRINATTWMLAPVAPDGDGGPAAERRFGEPGLLGPVWLALDAPEAPWIDAPVAEPRANPDTPPAQAEPDSIVAPAADSPPPSAPAPARRTREALYVYGGMVSMLMLSLAGLSFLLPPQQQRLAQADAQQLAIDASLPEIMRVLERLGLSQRLNVTRRPDRSIVVTGWLRDAAEQDALAAALSKIWPMPALRVTNEADMQATAEQVLKAYPLRYQTRYEGDGRVAVRGVAPDAQQRARVGDALRGALPGLRFDLTEVELADETAARLASAAADAGLPSLDMAWNGVRLEVSPPDDAGQTKKLAAVIDAFNAARFQIAFLQARPERPAPKRAIVTSVPFQIRSVMGGAQPFIVLGDGSKLTPGGIYQQYKLVSIENGTVTFDGPAYAVISR